MMMESKHLGEVDVEILNMKKDLDNILILADVLHFWAKIKEIYLSIVRWKLINLKLLSRKKSN